MTGSFTVNPVPTPPRPAEFKASNLQITPEEADTGEEIEISFTVTNVGEETGNYSFSLMIEGNFAIEIVEMVGALGAGESETATHTLTLETPGRYTITTYGLTGSFVLSEPLILPTPAEFEVSELEISPEFGFDTPFEMGEFVIITVLVKNIDDKEGSYTVEWKVDGETIDTQNVTLAAGSGRHARAYFEAQSPGTYQVRVGDLNETFTVRAPLEPAEFEFSNLAIVPGDWISIDEKRHGFTISVDVTNVGEEMGGCTVELKVDGKVVDSVEVPPFGGGVTATQFFNLTRSEGTYEVEVEGLTGSFTVVKPEPSFWDKIPGFPYESIILGLIVVIIIIWRARKF